MFWSRSVGSEAIGKQKQPCKLTFSVFLRRANDEVFVMCTVGSYGLLHLASMVS